MTRFIAAALVLAATLLGWAPSAFARPAFGDDILAFDHYVPHVSTIPAIAGQHTQLYVRERVLKGVLEGASTAANGRVVLFIHGGTYPVVPDYDLDYKDFSWMAYLAQAGFDVFAMDLTGYGKSTRPWPMDDPCNLSPAEQAILIPATLPAPCPPSYPFTLTNVETEVQEVNRVVDYLRELRGVEKVNLIGWSAAGWRFGPYAARWPEKVERMVLLAPAYIQLPTEPPTLPTAGFPMSISTRARAFNERWDIQVHCENQFEPAIRDVIWARNMEFDPVGASWGPGVVRRPSWTLFGWNRTLAVQIQAPTLLVTGEFDLEVSPASTRQLYADLGSTDKVRLEIQCASHYIPYETQYKTLHEASRSWLLHGSLKGVSRGVLVADPDGRIRKVKE